jgi:Beta-ketoacyl synthase, N-terminal domain
MTVIASPTAHLEAVGLLGPGLSGWAAGAAILRGDERYEPARAILPIPQALPSAERRRAGRVVRLVMAVADEAVRCAGMPGRELPSVFSSSGGDGDNCHEICQTLAGPERMLSPTRFHNSVHNAPAGYWSIAHGSMRPSTSLSAHDASFSAGLLEAFCHLVDSHGALLLICYDLDYPPPLRATRPIPDALGIALLLRAVGPGAGRSTLQLRLTAEPATCLADGGLESLRRAIPAARGLPLLAQLARQQPGTVVLDYLEGLRLAVDVRL